MNGSRIGTILNVPPGDLKLPVDEALSAIDGVHTFLDLSPIPVIYTDDNNPFGAYVPEREDEPRHFKLSRRGPHPRLTMAHEIGHLIDHALGKFDVYLSWEPNSPLSFVMRTIKRSKAIAQMRRFLTGQPDLERDVRMQLTNWLDPPEMWARAYAQYIATRSGNARLRNELQISIDLEGPEIYKNVQWDNSGFEPIARAIDDAFQKLGWLP